MRNKTKLELVNIYIKIHNKKALTMDDLAYLAKYNPVCFQKTCDNLFHKMPEAKPLAEPSEKMAAPEEKQNVSDSFEGEHIDIWADEMPRSEGPIMQFIANLKNIEPDAVSTVQRFDLSLVKELLGDLFMESLFPHNGVQGYFDVMDEEPASQFNVRV